MAAGSGAGMDGMRAGRASLRLAVAACAVLALAIVWQLAQFAWQLVPADDGSQVAPVRAASAASAPASVAVSKWHLFGAATLPAMANRDAPVTTLALRLRGTLADADPRAGIAVIADDIGNERAWRVGEQVTPGVILDEVHADRVVLMHAGAREVLALARDDAPAPPAPAPTAGPRNLGTPRNTAPTPPDAAVQPVFVAPKIAHGAVDWQQAMDQVAGGSAADLARRVQVTPVLDNGRIAGLRVSTAGDPALMARLGLRPSDIVTAVNGIPVDSVARGQQILDSLGSATEVRVTVTRDGMPAELALKLR